MLLLSFVLAFSLSFLITERVLADTVSYEGYKKVFLRSDCKKSTDRICVIRDFPDIIIHL